MHRRNGPPNQRAWAQRAGLAGLCMLAGCQSYEPVAIDLAAHRERLNARAMATEPLNGFIDRLSETNPHAPDRFDATDGISLPEAEVLALFYNADLRLARLNAGIKRANYDTAGLWEDPEFGFDGADIFSPGGPFEYGLMLNLTIPVSGRLGVEKDRAGAAYEAERCRIIDAEWTLRARVRVAWAEWSAASERLILLRDAVPGVERIAAIASKLEEAGELGRVEARLLRAEAVELRGRLLAAEHAEVVARLDLLGLMGLPPASSIPLEPAFSVIAPPEPEDPASRMIRSNTALAVLRAEYQVAEEALRLEVRKQYPDITIGAGYGSESDDDRLLLGLSLPIPILNANRGGIAEATARRDVARAIVETGFERLMRDLASARSELTAARSMREAFAGELVPMLEQQAMEAERLAELGEVDTLLLLESVTRRLEAKSTLLDLRVSEIRAAAEMTRLLGPATEIGPAPVNTTPDQTDNKQTTGETSR